MSPSLFLDSELERKVQEEGVVTIPFLTKEELANIQSFYQDIHGGGLPPDLIDGIHMTSWCGDLNYKLQIKENLEKLTQTAGARHFKNCRKLNHVFIVKRSGNETTFPIHQDWNVVDETQYPSFNVWIPLQDVDESNGALWVIKGSHRINRKVRGAGYLFPNYTHLYEDLKPLMTPYPVPAGHAVIFYHGVIHGSPPNTSTPQRITATFSIVPEKAPLHIHFQPSENSPLEVHQPADDFLYKYKSLRTETLTRPPTEQAFMLKEAYENIPPVLSDFAWLNPAFKAKSWLERLMEN